MAMPSTTEPSKEAPLEVSTKHWCQIHVELCHNPKRQPETITFLVASTRSHTLSHDHLFISDLQLGDI